ncbi:MAG: hypothetical protein IJO60_08470, partial [Agathobacter sp.]|nr:hypothetical protein [Agathobacter sp.]
IPLDMLKEVVKEHPSLNVSILYDGEFGFEAELSIYLGTEYANDSADLYYYNELDSKLEYVSQQEIATDGTLKFMFTHASEYAIVINTEDDANVQEDTEIENDDEKADETEKPVDTGVNLWWLIPLLIIVVVIVAYVKNKKQKK